MKIKSYFMVKTKALFMFVLLKKSAKIINDTVYDNMNHQSLLTEQDKMLSR